MKESSLIRQGLVFARLFCQSTSGPQSQHSSDSEVAKCQSKNSSRPSYPAFSGAHPCLSHPGRLLSVLATWRSCDVFWKPKAMKKRVSSLQDPDRSTWADQQVVTCKVEASLGGKRTPTEIGTPSRQNFGRQGPAVTTLTLRYLPIIVMNLIPFLRTGPLWDIIVRWRKGPNFSDPDRNFGFPSIWCYVRLGTREKIYFCAA